MIDSQGSDMTRILLLGGTTEAGLMARALAGAGIDAVYSYAGRTATPAAQPLPVRIGGFGGIEGLCAYLRDHGISHLIDATHPFAGQMSAHAVAASHATGTPLLALERAPWQPGPGDRWIRTADVAAAVASLPEDPARVFLAIGKQSLDAFAARPQHHYLLRLVDPPEAALPVPQARVILGRGPFTPAGDLALLRDHGVQIVVAKNAGGQGAEAKLAAARALALPVILIERPQVPPRASVETVAEAMGWLHHGTRRGV
jgi:precorrin-6A/cobalt-precorrin-6A reductase